MKAVVCTRSGPPEVLQLSEVAVPTPRSDEVLVRVHAASVTPGDVMLRKLHPALLLPMRLFGVKPKRIPGHEFAGEITAVGADVSAFQVGEAVFGTTTGLRVGANAEYVCLPATSATHVIAHKPANLSYAEAAVVPVGGLTALAILKRSTLERGMRVLVYGASGSVGTYAVQLARHFGASVTGVCSTPNVALVRSLGADAVIDYTAENVLEGDALYDIVFDVVGKLTASDCQGILKQTGTFLTVQTTVKESATHLQTLKKLVELGMIKPVIDKRFTLEQVAEAHRYVETGRKRGNVAIIVIEDETNSST